VTTTPKTQDADVLEIEVTWSDRSYNLMPWLAQKIEKGATRNLQIQNLHQGVTTERIVEDLEHIHNLFVVDIRLTKTNEAFVSLNSVSHALTARMCLISRVEYKNPTRITWYADECALPIPKVQTLYSSTIRELPKRKLMNPLKNRFQALSFDSTNTSDSSESSSIKDSVFPG